MTRSALPGLWGVPAAWAEPPRWRVPGARPLTGREEAAAPSWREGRLTLPDGREVHLRPVRPDDARREAAFHRALSPDARLHRFHQPLHELPPSMVDRLVRADARQFALVAEVGDDLVADARWVLADDADDRAEFALVVADDWQRGGLGLRMLLRLMAEARARGVRELLGDVMHDNAPMARLLKRAGGGFEPGGDPRVRRAVIRLA